MSAALFSLFLLAARGDEMPPFEKGTKPLLIVMNEVVDRLLPRFLAPPSPEARRISIRDGLVGVGAYVPRGWTDAGYESPPLQLFPKAGAGNSLNVDPITGRNYWNHMP
jgi:hypothetical protein